MGILNITIGSAGLVDVTPIYIYINTNDTFNTVTATGYLNNARENGYDFTNTQMALVNTTDDGVVILQVNVTPTEVSLIPITGGSGEVILPVVDGDFAVFSGIKGAIKDAGYSPSNAAKTKVVMSNGAQNISHIAVFVDTAGTVTDDAAVAINNGDFQAGSSGTQGTYTSFPATAATGNMLIGATSNSGNFVTTITNRAMGQASTIRIPDPGAASANFVLDTGNTTFAAGAVVVVPKNNGTESGNALTANGMSGYITTSSLTTAGGASYAITWTNSAITSTSVVLLTLMGGTNTTNNLTLKCTSGGGTCTLTIYNNTASTAFNGTVILGYLVI